MLVAINNILSYCERVMSMLFTLFLFFYWCAISITAYLSIKSLYHRHLPIAVPVGLFSMVLMGVCILQIITLTAQDLTYLQLVSDTGFLLLCTTIPLWVWTFYEYQAERKGTPPWFWLLLIEPLIALGGYGIHGFYVLNTDCLLYTSPSPRDRG